MSALSFVLSMFPEEEREKLEEEYYMKMSETVSGQLTIPVTVIEHTKKKVQKYIPYKLGRRVDPVHQGWPAVENGQIFGSCTAAVYDWEKQEPILEEEQFVPRIGKCVWIKGRGFRDTVRTSQISDYYIHDEPELSKDKIVLPMEHAKMLEGVKWSKGDVLLVTLNSLYYLKAINSKED